MPTSASPASANQRECRRFRYRRTATSRKLPLTPLTAPEQRRSAGGQIHLVERVRRQPAGDQVVADEIGIARLRR